MGAVPFAVLGFVRYNGVTAEKFIAAWIKSNFIIPKRLTFKAKNIYYEMFKPIINLKQGLIKPQTKKKERKNLKPKKEKNKKRRRGKLNENIK